MIDPSVRSDFPIFSVRVNDKPLVYFDNSATSQKPNSVIKALTEYYQTYNANIHRGIHELSEKATEAYEQSKEKVAKLINAESAKEIIYTRNTTESINLVTHTWALENLSEGDIIVLSEMEHHSNIVPWQIVARQTKSSIEYIPVKSDYTLDLDAYKEILKKKPKIVSVVHASNVLGTVNPIKEIVKLAKKSKALTLIDGAQSVPHMQVDVRDIDCDFFAFSSHKMCGPTGIGVLYGKKELLTDMPPFLSGGDMIRKVTYKSTTWNHLPWKFEAGTPDIADGIAFGAAVEYLKKLGLDTIEHHEREITNYALERMQEITGLKIFGQDSTPRQRGGMISFTLESAHPHDIAEILNEDGIAIRSGHHCAQPLHTRFKKAATARASFYLYNTKEEVDRFIESLARVNKIFN